MNLHVSLLVALGRDERVDLLHLDAVQLLASLLDGGLGGALVNDEHEGVMVFDSLDDAFAREWVLHNCILVPS